MSKEQFDKLVSKWISRKLLVFVIATIYLACGLVTNSQWVYIALMYIGVEALLNKYKQ
jgi:hypothetical protein